MTETATCRRCRRTKPRADFKPNPDRPPGISPWCKDCHREAVRASWRKHGDRYMAARRKPLETRACTVCGREFATPKRVQLYCSARCKRGAKYLRRKAKGKR